MYLHKEIEATLSEQFSPQATEDANVDAQSVTAAAPLRAGWEAIAKIDTDAAVARGRRLQARATGEYLVAFFAPVVKPVAAGFAALARRQRMVNDANALRSLDDRMLADIGVQRSEIDHIIRSDKGPGFWELMERMPTNRANGALREVRIQSKPAQATKAPQANIFQRAFWALSRLATHNHANDSLRHIDPAVQATTGIAGTKVKSFAEATTRKPSNDAHDIGAGPIGHAA